jgi:hypothetical protein
MAHIKQNTKDKQLDFLVLVFWWFKKEGRGKKKEEYLPHFLKTEMTEMSDSETMICMVNL